MSSTSPLFLSERLFETRDAVKAVSKRYRSIVDFLIEVGDIVVIDKEPRA